MQGRPRGPPRPHTIRSVRDDAWQPVFRAMSPTSGTTKRVRNSPRRSGDIRGSAPDFARGYIFQQASTSAYLYVREIGDLCEPTHFQVACLGYGVGLVQDALTAVGTIAYAYGTDNSCTFVAAAVTSLKCASNVAAGLLKSYNAARDWSRR